MGPPQTPLKPPATIDLVIESLGAQGDGIARLEGKRVFVPGALPGERIRARIERETADGVKGTALEFLTRAPDRAEPACPHFGDCGGCAMQHLSPHRYAEWKLERMRQSLAHRGLSDATIAPPIVAEPGTRRRARLAAAREHRDTTIGFRARGSHRIVDIAACPILSPGLMRLVPPLRTLLSTMLSPRKQCEVALTESKTGIDLLLIGKLAPDLAARERLVQFANSHDIARLSVQAPKAEAEPIVIRRPVLASFGGIPVELPIGAFLQPTKQGEAAIVHATQAATQGAKRVADLYCGCGSVGLSLAQSGAKVQAFDQDGDMCAALSRAAAAAGAPLLAQPRNLARSPLMPNELDRFDAVVFDPPRAGAKAQAAQLAESRVPRIVAISCNPATFARDARSLVDGGYRLERIVPLDQFLWSPHVELIASFSR